MTVGAMSQRMPAEFEPHERTIMCWPTCAEIWGSMRHRAEEDYATIVTEIGAFEPVIMIAPESSAARAVDLCGPGVDVVTLPINDSWARDSGPMYVTQRAGGPRLALDWTFNGWGGKFEPFDDDACLVERWCQLWDEPRRSIDMVLEGGAITLDGEGTLVTTEQCLLHPNRNPTMSRAAIEHRLRDELGVSAVVWIPFGLELDDDTDGHVDNVAAFCRSGADPGAGLR